MDNKELLKQARLDCKEAANLADMVINGDINMPIGDMLGVFAIVKYWKDCYDAQIKACSSSSVVAGCAKWSVVFQSKIEEFHEIFFDFEMQIVDYFRGLKKLDMTKEEIAVAEVFINSAKQDKYLAWDWDKFQLQD